MLITSSLDKYIVEERKKINGLQLGKQHTGTSHSVGRKKKTQVTKEYGQFHLYKVPKQVKLNHAV